MFPFWIPSQQSPCDSEMDLLSIHGANFCVDFLSFLSCRSKFLFVLTVLSSWRCTAIVPFLFFPCYPWKCSCFFSLFEITGSFCGPVEYLCVSGQGTTWEFSANELFCRSKTKRAGIQFGSLRPMSLIPLQIYSELNMIADVSSRTVECFLLRRHSWLFGYLIWLNWRERAEQAEK